MSYAIPADILARYDNNRLGDLVKDDQTRASATDLLTDPNLQAALDDASGRIESALLRGRRYSLTDLTSLTNNSASLLIRLNCDLAYGFLVQRRGYNSVDQGKLAPGVAWAEGVLEQLANGEAVFNLDPQTGAGLPVRTVLSKNILFLTDESDRLFGEKSPPGSP